VSRILTVITPIPNSFHFSPVQPNVGQVVQFTDTSTGSPTSWLWDFGDGTTSTVHDPSHGYAVAGCYTVTLTVGENSGPRTVKLPINVMSASAIMIDHHNTKLASIPSEWIAAAKRNLHIAYGMTSRGGQLTYGMTGLVGWKGSQYSWNPGGTDGALDLRNWVSSGGEAFGFGYPEAQTIAYDLGNPDRTAWEAATREYLALHPEVNVVVWSWCSQMTDPDPLTVQLYYLDLMARLEVDFRNVKFVYMTGHTAGGWWGEGAEWRYVNYMRCKQIREHCIKNNRILYDFNDIESWDPDGNWYGDKLVNDSCDYDSDGDYAWDRNWAVDWQNAHPGEWFMCLAQHTQPLSANLKTYAAWWLWARLAGWDGR
jgi:PKD repeat protein